MKKDNKEIVIALMVCLSIIMVFVVIGFFTYFYNLNKVDIRTEKERCFDFCIKEFDGDFLEMQCIKEVCESNDRVMKIYDEINKTFIYSIEIIEEDWK